MKKIILEWVANFIMTRFGITAEEKTSISKLNSAQLEELLKAVNNEYNTRINLSDVEGYMEKFGNVTLFDLAAIIFSKCI